MASPSEVPQPDSRTTRSRHRAGEALTRLSRANKPVKARKSSNLVDEGEGGVDDVVQAGPSAGGQSPVAGDAVQSSQATVAVTKQAPAKTRKPGSRPKPGSKQDKEKSAPAPAQVEAEFATHPASSAALSAHEPDEAAASRAFQHAVPVDAQAQASLQGPLFSAPVPSGSSGSSPIARPTARQAAHVPPIAKAAPVAHPSQAPTAPPPGNEPEPTQIVRALDPTRAHLVPEQHQPAPPSPRLQPGLDVFGMPESDLFDYSAWEPLPPLDVLRSQYRVQSVVGPLPPPPGPVLPTQLSFASPAGPIAPPAADIGLSSFPSPVAHAPPPPAPAPPVAHAAPPAPPVAHAAPPAPPAPPVALEQFEFVPADSLPKARRKPGTDRLPAALRNVPVLRTGPRENFVQQPNVPQSIFPGASALATFLAPGGIPPGEVELDDDMVDFLGPAPFDAEEEVALGTADNRRHAVRRAAQHATWRDAVIPTLIRPFVRHLHGLTPDAQTERCDCSGIRRVTITLADWEGTTTRAIYVCRCAPAARQLVDMGYFPCAPKRPSTAFSLRLLELISLHSLHVAPNNTAWATTLEAFWARRGFSIVESKAFRKRLANAVHWYQVLVNCKDAQFQAVKADHRRSVFGKRKAVIPADGESDRASKRARMDGDVRENASEEGLAGAGTEAELSSAPDISGQRDQPARQRNCESDEDEIGTGSASDGDDEPEPGPSSSAPPLRRSARIRTTASQSAAQESRKNDSPPSSRRRSQRPGSQRDRPSDYLHQRCPLCFGGQRPEFEHTDAHAIVCLDANFAQKRRKSKATDPALSFVGGRFVPADEVDEMEREVEEKRKRPARRRRTGQRSQGLGDEVLDECESSFIAAQEKVTKASKNYYADTGLMALLCRHDRVLFLANMTSPGERQHYALILLRKLFDELPDNWNVGVLYDIACQLARSIDKHNLLDPFAERIVFGVSVFHAYGHQWACQLVFHPRKRKGFGLTDGEGCERFWSSIRHLISCLRVSGFHRRLFVIDRQVAFLEEQNLFKLGRWLSKRWTDMEQKQREAERKLALCGVDSDELRAQWQAQIAAQIAPQTRQSKYAGDKQVNKMLLDLALVDDLQDQMREDRAALKKSAHKLAAREVQELTSRIEQAQHDIKATKARVSLAQSQLGTGSLRAFQELRGDAYIRARVNARALRVNIRIAVQAHKFERETLERNYRRQIMQNKDHAQTRDLVHTREKGITGLVKKYNTLVTHMEVLIRDLKAPKRKMAVPRKLDAKALFRLDVDDDIWDEDPGLGPQDEGELPRWQVDQAVRKGIRFLLEVTRCREERERLECEAKALHSWWVEEDRVLHLVQRSNVGDDLLQLEADAALGRLRYLAMVWTKALAGTGLALRFGLDAKADADVDQESAAHIQESAARGVPTDDAVDAPDLDAEPRGDVGSESGSEGSFYMSGDEATDAEDEEYDASLLDMVTVVATDSGSETDTERRTQAADADSGSDDDARFADATDGKLPAPRVVESSNIATAEIGEAAVTKGLAALPRGVSRLADGTYIISSDEDDAGRESSKAVELGRMCGTYVCTGDDVARMASQTAWLSGSGLAVFAESKTRLAGDGAVGHCPSTLLVDVRNYMEAELEGDEEKMAMHRNYVWGMVKTLPHPGFAKKWLIVSHIETPEHWTLAAVFWAAREVRFYDSLAAKNRYDLRVKERVFALLKLCESFYEQDLAISQWTWIGEKRGVRQRNYYDCGPFIAADFVSLLNSDAPSTLSQDDMRRWREEMCGYMRGLPRYRRRPREALTAAQLEQAIVIEDGDDVS